MFLITYIIGFAQRAFERTLLKTISSNISERLRLPNIIFNKRKRYLREVENNLGQMPFLYKEKEEDLIKDFVDISIQTVDVFDLKLIGKTPGITDTVITSNKLKEENKILIIGNAGIGKTTLLRHTVLSIIKNIKTTYFKSTKRKILPIFIALKSIRNTKKSPIVSFILENIPFFEGSKGIEKFKKLADERSIFLALDGYDEIGFVAKESYLQEELSLLLNSTLISQTSISNIKPEYFEIYQKLTKCKVWLSTREEFYRLNPLIKDKDGKVFSSTPTFSGSFSALKITGLGENRLEFVRRIFNNYKKKGLLFVNLLDEEQFIEDIDTTYDKELINLSRIPLFLTIMCYLYVNRIECEERLVSNWLSKFEDLVKECVQVMLVDLDRFKVRNLSLAQREAFRRRRNSYVDEKTEFLNQFSLLLLIDSAAVFDVDYLNSAVIKFFKESSTSENSSKILTEYTSPSSNNPNFSIQLLHSGLFTIVGEEDKKLLYDFPHRRFKEVLALEALQLDYNFYLLEKNIANKNLSEFVLLTFRSNNTYRNKVFRILLDVLLTTDNEYANLLLDSCLKDEVANDNDLTVYLETFLSTIFQRNTFVPISKRIFEKIQLTSNFILNLLQDKRFSTPEEVMFSFEILRETDYKMFIDKLTGKLKEVLTKKVWSKCDDVIFKLVIQEQIGNGSFDQVRILMTVGPYVKTVSEKLNFRIEANSDLQIRIDEKHFLKILLSTIVSNRYYQASLFNAVFDIINSELHFTDKVLLFGLLRKFNDERFSHLRGVSDYYNLIEIIEYFSDFNRFQALQESNILKNLSSEINDLVNKIDPLKKDKLNGKKIDEDKLNSYIKTLESDKTLVRSINLMDKHYFASVVTELQNINANTLSYLQGYIYS